VGIKLIKIDQVRVEGAAGTHYIICKTVRPNDTQASNRDKPDIVTIDRRRSPHMHIHAHTRTYEPSRTVLSSL